MGVGTGILAPSAVDARAKRERTAGVGSDLSGRRRLCFAPEFVDTIGGRRHSLWYLSNAPRPAQDRESSSWAA